MLNSLPVGTGVFYEEKDGLYQPTIMAKKASSNSSQISLHWLNHMQQKFVKNGNISIIKCSINGTEEKIGPFFLDGFVIFENKRIGLDFKVFFTFK